MQEKRLLYNELTWIWPVIAPPEQYEEETEFLSSLVKKYSHSEAKTLLHLGCGGGYNDFTFKKHFKVTGIDISKKMLELAKKLNPENEYLPGDMRTIRLNRKFDVVVSVDSIGYMKTEKELLKAFQTAYDHLNHGGIFLNLLEITRENFKQNNTEHCTLTQKNLEVTYIENHYDPDPNDNTFEILLVYLIRKDGKLEIFNDLHILSIFEVKTWNRLLKKAGFEVHEEKFTHSTFEKGKFLPLLVCIKK